MASSQVESSQLHAEVDFSSRDSTFGVWATLVPGVISTANSSGIFYRTVLLVDSTNNTGGFVNLTPPMNTTVSSIQVFRCFLSLVEQNALVDAQSRQAVALSSELIKTTSVWHPVTLQETALTTGNPLFDLVLDRHSEWPFAESCSGEWGMILRRRLVSHATLACGVISRFQISNESRVPTILTLHDFENTQAELVASIFWTSENTAVTEQTAKIRLNVWIGLAASIVLMLISLEHLLPAARQAKGQKTDKDPPIE
ncbi:hypothetical protein K438DRAFT_1774926 [Mycena galopus ATCC 62051]|nr:hypothetical protein K438DRAFT_1774926 [Mycena galopus ATCC 62051]